MGKIRILYFITNMDIAGAQRFVTDIITHLDTDKYEVALMVIDEFDENFLIKRLRKKCVNIIGISKHSGSFRRIRVLNRIIKEIKMYKPDVIQSNLDYSYSWLSAFLLNIPIVVTIHSEPFRIISTSKQLLYRCCKFKGLVYVILPCKTCAEDFSRLFKAKREEEQVIPNPVCLDEFGTCREEKSGDAIHFVTVSRFHQVKNNHEIIKAFCELREEKSNVYLDMYGDGELFEDEQKYVESINMGEFIKLHGSADNISEVLKDMDVFVQFSKSECFPISVLEAMASGLPVIASDVGGLNDMIFDNGFLVKSYSELVDAMKKLTDDTDLRDRMSKKSFELVRQYDVVVVTKEYEALYDHIVGGLYH